MKEDKRCPKCGERLSFFYLKQTCPGCGADLLRYDMEGRLERDAERAAKEVENLWRFLRKADKAHVIEKYYTKKGKPFPWEETASSSEQNDAVPTESVICADTQKK